MITNTVRKYLSNIRFVDDIMFFTLDPVELERIIVKPAK